MNYLTSYFASKKWIEKQKTKKGLRAAVIIINKMDILSSNVKNLITKELEKEMK